MRIISNMGSLRCLFKHSALIIRMGKREIVGKYKGAVLGLLWAYFNPLVMLAVYMFVFGIVFKAKWGVDTEKNFALLLFAGLICHSVLAECIIRAPHLVIQHVNYVKKVVFPLETLSWIAVLAAFFHFVVSLSVLATAQILMEGRLPVTWLFMPFIAAPLVLICLGASWFLSSLGVYLRDISQLTTIVVPLLLFLCPIFYPMEAIPLVYRPFIQLNPLTVIVEQTRNVLILSQTPNWLVLGVYTGVSFVFAQCGYWWFMRTKKGFADVL
jgi:lipopolysaccharide transport system permease protein